MNKFLCIANAVLTLPFGIACVFAPVAVFAGFGLNLDAGAQLIARGYAATCIGYGAVFLLLRDSQDARVLRALLLGSVFFNGIECVFQGMGGAQGVASPAVWGTVGVHGVMTVLSVLGYLRVKKVSAAV